MVVAKPLAAGLPLGAILTSEAVAHRVSPGLHGTTFGGGPLACAVAVAVIDFMEREHLLEHVQTVGGYFKQQLQSLASKHPGIREVRGMGLMLAVDLESEELAKSVAAAMMKRRIILNRTSETVLRFLPPYILEKEHVDTAVDALDQILNEYSPTVASSTGAAHFAGGR